MRMSSADCIFFVFFCFSAAGWKKGESSRFLPSELHGEGFTDGWRITCAAGFFPL